MTVLTFGVRLIVFLVDVKSGYFTEKTSHVRILPCSSGVPRNSGENTFLGTVWIGDSLAGAVQDDEYLVAILVRSNRIAVNGSITIVVITECVADRSSSLEAFAVRPVVREGALQLEDTDWCPGISPTSIACCSV